MIREMLEGLSPLIILLKRFMEGTWYILMWIVDTL